MAEVSSELIYEVLKQVRDDVSLLKHGQGEVKAELQAIRGHMIAMQQDIHNIYTTLARHDVRIERRLELTEPATI